MSARTKEKQETDKPPRRFAEGYDPETRKTADENRAGRRAGARLQEREVRRFIRKLEDESDEIPRVTCQRCKTPDAFATYVAPRPPRRRAAEGEDDLPAVQDKREPLVRTLLRKCRHCGVARDRPVRKKPSGSKRRGRAGGKRGRNSGKVSQHGKKT